MVEGTQNSQLIARLLYHDSQVKAQPINDLLLPELLRVGFEAFQLLLASMKCSG